jgi:hypothetical protein
MERLLPKPYVCPIELEEEDDSRWSAWIAILPGCSCLGPTKDEALLAINNAAQAYQAESTAILTAGAR